MRYLHYTNYQSGCAGLSNGIMSIEVGVVLAHLTNRLLVLEGNVPPPANIVTYDDRVDTLRPSRVTDLLELPVPWVEPGAVELTGLESLELTTLSLSDFAFYFPKTLDLTTADAQSFARDRRHWLTVSGAHERIPVLRLSEDAGGSGAGHRDNLCYYGYLFYFDRETRRSVYRLLQRLQPKAPFAELAQRVARDLGAFNAVHLRRGDFKVTYGVTTLDRKPAEAIEAMDQLFSRKDPLVIVTDERDDPFFTEIKLAYPHHYFIDWHILDNYGPAFAQLPQTDSLSLACLSQLVAAESKEFIGTMTSTFTGLIQRYRGNRGKPEAFRYLWNELPESHHDVERGRHAISECIPLDRGQMIEQFPGPYSWNRVSPLLSPSWMREWPESFLLPEVIATGALAMKADSAPELVSARIVTPTIASPPSPALRVGFEDLQVAVWSKDAAIMRRLSLQLDAAPPDTPARNVIATFEVHATGTACHIQRKGDPERTPCALDQLAGLLKRRMGTVFATARHQYAWLAGAAFVKDGRGLLIVGKVGGNIGAMTGDWSAFRRLMELGGWESLAADVCAVRVDDLMLIPLGAQTGAAAQTTRAPTPLDRLVVARRAPTHARETSLTPCAPAAAVAALIGHSLDFRVDRTRAVNWLCRIVEQRPAVQVQVGRTREAALKVTKWADTRVEVAA